MLCVLWHFITSCYCVSCCTSLLLMSFFIVAFLEMPCFYDMHIWAIIHMLFVVMLLIVL
jgi:hypothetical protein